MIKKYPVFFALAAFLVLLCGCATSKGAIEGAQEDYKGAVHGAKVIWAGTTKGSAQIAKKSVAALQKMDSWVRENLW